MLCNDNSDQNGIRRLDGWFNHDSVHLCRMGHTGGFAGGLYGASTAAALSRTANETGNFFVAAVAGTVDLRASHTFALGLTGLMAAFVKRPHNG